MENNNFSETTYEVANNSSKVMGIISLVLVIVSIVSGCLMLCCGGWVGILSAILGIAGLIFGILSKKKEPEASGMALAGIITSVVGILLGIVLVVMAICGAAVLLSNGGYTY